MRLYHSDREQIGRNDPHPGTHWSAAAAATGRGTSRAHARWSRRCGRGDGFWRLDCGQLLDYRGRCCRWRHFIIVTAATQVDDVGVVRVLQNADEVSLAQAFAIAAEQLTRRCACVAGADWTASVHAHRSSYEIKRLFTSETQSAGSDVTHRHRRLTSRFGAGRQFSFSWWASSGRLPMTASLAIASPATPSSATRTFSRFGLSGGWLTCSKGC